MILYLLDYNNYATRKKKSETSIQKYLNYRIGNPIENVAFNPNDGITTQMTIPYEGYTFSTAEPNYAILVDDEKIVSRWFIIELQRLRKGLYTATLRRDLLVDYNGEYIAAPCFIEKAMLYDSDPFIHNPEEMTFNQIKKKEILLKDPSHCAWIVGYINKNRNGNQTITSEVTGVGTYITYNSISSYPYYDALNEMIYEGPITNAKYSIIIEDGTPENVGKSYNITFDETGWHEWRQSELSLPVSQRDIFKLSYNQYEENVGTVIARVVNQWAERIRNFRVINTIATANGNHTIAETSEFLNKVPELIKLVDTGEYVNIKRGPATSTTKNFVPTNGSNLALELADVLSYPSEVITSWDFASKISYFVSLILNYEFYGVVQTEYLPFRYEMTLYGPSSIVGLNDAPYDMFAIPYPLDEYEISCSVKESGEIKTGVIEQEAGMMIGNKIAETLTEAGCYDIQLLPYCPIPSIANQYAHIDLTNLELNKDYCLITATHDNQTTIRNVCIFPTKSTFTRNLYEYWDRPSNTIKSYSIKINNKKIQSLTEFCRICSPNYNGQFEFSPAKNDGVDYFNIDCTYKPFSPYIHISPNFKGLYGSDFDDARGLICGGDFSLPRTSDKWQEYQIQNKNYQNSFNRQIENMEISQKYARTSEIVNAIAGGAAGTISGGTTGALIGGGVGAGIGAVVGGAVSTAGAIADININDKLRNEAIDYTKDMFGYSLENIQALPYSLSRVSSFNANNKIFPILEFYSASDEEKEALKNKIKYNGMTVMRFGKIQNYNNLNYDLNYIKGRLVLHSGHGIDAHTANEIVNEVYKGFYIENKTGGIEL